MRRVGPLFVIVVGLSAIVGLREPTVTAQSGGAPPTVSLRRNNAVNAAVWPGDFNGDGIIDLAANDPFTPSGPLALVALGRGDGTFGTPIRTQCACSVLDVGDFDNDGKADLLVAPTSGPVLVLPGKGDGTFGSGKPVAQPASFLRAGFVADVDGDHNIDVVLLAGDEFDGQVMVVPGNGNLTFRTATILTAPTVPYGGTVADLNGDGKTDIVVANHDGQSLSIFLNQGAFTFASADMPLDRQANDVVSVDLNRDGKMDLIVATSSPADDDRFYVDGHAYVLLGNGNGTFAQPAKYETARGAWRVVVGDFNRDGKLDVATANRSAIVGEDICGSLWDTVTILPGSSDGTLGAASSFALGDQRSPNNGRFSNSVRSLRAADLNGDGQADLVASWGAVLINNPPDPNWGPTVAASSTQPDANTHSITLMASADDVDQDMLTYAWSDSGGGWIAPVPNPCFTPSTLGVHTFTVTVNDGHGHTASHSVTVDFGGGGGSRAPIMTITAPTAGATLAAGTPYEIKFHIDDPATDLYEWTIDYSLDNGTTWNHIWECHNAGQQSQPGDPTSRDASCMWRNPGPPSAQAILFLYAQDDADALIGTPSSVRVTIVAAEGAVPDPWQHQDIGAVGAAGTATAFDATTFTVRGSGADIWGTADEFHFVYQRTYSSLNDQAPFEFTARVDSVENVHAWTKAGLMIRSGLGANAPHAMVVVSPARGIAFQRRTAAGSVTVSTAGPLVAAPVWLKLAVQGTTVTAYYRKNLTDLWTVVGRQELPDFDDVAIGMVVTSHADGTSATATFSNVAVRYIDAWTSTDIQTTGGSTTSDGVITSVTGKGADAWSTSDQFRFVWTSWYLLDGSMTARVRDVQNVHAWTKAGVMFRERSSTNMQDPSAKYVFVMVTPGKGVSMQYRGTTGGAAASVGTVTGVAPGWMRLTRVGDVYTGGWSKDGVTWASLGSVTVPMNRLSTGLAVTSHSTSAAVTARFDDVAIAR